MQEDKATSISLMKGIYSLLESKYNEVLSTMSTSILGRDLDSRQPNSEDYYSLIQ